MAYTQTQNSSVSGDGNGARIVGSDSSRTAGPGPSVMASSTLDGDRVFSSNGDEVGKVKDIMIDVQSGRIAYMVMSSGGFLGIGDKLLAVPWNALTLDADRKCFVLDLTSERVKNAPGFDKGHWPSMADRTWASSVHQYYGREPYWGSDRGLPLEEPGEPPEAGGVKL
ncbi:PRC-barrel domain-containing protein [Paraburkholderia acidisoli]|jgi:sporulation protein YlmC with PRC-barrel domain|uniref:PRC-barrel domain containing protein n=1 Tax=Paraburkholderia acidisoli TaxID=2571748 RepID=A0A7Z2JFK3_9BURK|nr:PRC-barrel domain-containing protein [Paraburkholderia acidisoli]QGZ63532.1 PRC-barrel domain containing protein [Paraburkholderia acidisoli]